MHRKDYIPRSDLAFLEWAGIFVNRLPALMDRIGFPAETYAQLKALYDDFAAKMTAVEDTSTRTRAAVLLKNDARKTLEAAIRHAVKWYLTGNELLTVEDRTLLGLRIYKTHRSLTPAPTVSPLFSIEPKGGQRLSIRFSASSEKFRHIYAKPEGVRAVEIQWSILAEPPHHSDDLRHSVIATRSPYIFQFAMEEAGKRCYFCLRWENTRGEKGPWSPIQHAIIP
jgi:hypothetical protein